VPATPLSEFVRDQFFRAYHREPTSRTLAEVSNDKFNHGTAARILNGTHGNVDEKTIEGLSAALRVPTSRVRQILGQPVHDLGPFELPRRANRLTSKERALVVSVVDAILAAHDRRESLAPPGPGLRRVARKKPEK
jgi:hypothetical protein